MGDRKNVNWWRRLEILWLIAFTTALVIAWQANQNRINDIQNSRRQSCERTYEGIRQVFKPFLSGPQTATQKKNIDKFNHRIDVFKSRCAIQTHSNK